MFVVSILHVYQSNDYVVGSPVLPRYYSLPAAAAAPWAVYPVGNMLQSPAAPQSPLIGRSLVSQPQDMLAGLASSSQGSTPTPGMLRAHPLVDDVYKGNTAQTSTDDRIWCVCFRSGNSKSFSVPDANACLLRPERSAGDGRRQESGHPNQPGIARPSSGQLPPVGFGFLSGLQPLQ